MKKLLAILIAVLMVFSLVACDMGDNPDNDKDNPGVSQSGENNDSQGGESTNGNDDQGGENTNQGGNQDEEDTIADCNASLTAAGFNGFSFPTDLTDVEIAVYNDEGAQVIYAPVDNARYDSILQSLFSGTGMTAVHSSTGTELSSLDEVKSSDTKGNYTTHSFQLKNGDTVYQVAVTYYPNEYKDLMYSKTYAAQSLKISIRKY